MTLTEAQQWGVLIATVDEGCRGCAKYLLEKVRIAFPEFWWGQVDTVTWYKVGPEGRIAVYPRGADGGPIGPTKGYEFGDCR